MDSIKEKIRKLLALASGGNENEAALALAKAQELMTIHRLSQIDIELSGKIVDSPIIEDINPIIEGGRVPSWKFRLVGALAKHNNCSVLKFAGMGTSAKRETQIRIFGRSEDIDIVRYMLAFIVVELTRISSIANMGQGHRYADSWYNGAVVGINNRLNECRVKLEETTNKFALIKLDNKLQQVDEYINNKYKVSTCKSSNKTFNHEAYNSGYNTGKLMNIGNQSSLKQSKTLAG